MNELRIRVQETIRLYEEQTQTRMNGDDIHEVLVMLMSRALWNGIQPGRVAGYCLDAAISMPGHTADVIKDMVKTMFEEHKRGKEEDKAARSKTK